MPRPVHRAAASVLAASVAIGALVGPAAAFGPTEILRTSADLPRVEALAARGSSIGVVWSESDGTPSVWYRMSRNTGGSWTAATRLDPLPNGSPSAAVCMGKLWIASTIEPVGSAPGEQDLVIDGKDLDGFGSMGLLITSLGAGSTVQSPMIACVGDRFLAVIWQQYTPAGGWRARMLVQNPNAPLLSGDPGPSYAEVRDLGRTDSDVAPSIAATNTRVVMTWSNALGLRFRAYTLPRGAEVALRDRRDGTVAAGAEMQTAIAIDGARVIVAYTKDRDLHTRMSTNGGVTFARAVRRMSNPPGTTYAIATSLDMQGASVLLNAAHLTLGLPSAEEQWRFRSSDGGVTLRGRAVGSGGRRVGVLAGSARLPRAAEAWDHWLGGPAADRIEFHVEG